MRGIPRQVAPERLVLGAAALFSGVALLSNILFDVPFTVALAAAALAMVAAVAFLVWRLDARRRATLGRVVAAGAVAGIVATVFYDVAKTVLSQVDPSPYNPFEATRAFGALLLGPTASDGAVHAAGFAVHMLNGTAFGVAFTAVLGNPRHRLRMAMLLGVGWGLVLELFQLTLYPGWLDIRAYREFATISALSHVVYGATLGLTATLLLRRFLAGPVSSGRPAPL